MQKHASTYEFINYETIFDPLPVEADALVYCDRNSIGLPYAEDFPKLHYHDRYEIGICDSGEGIFLSENVYSSIKKGDIVFITPQSRHYSRSLNKDDICQCRFIYINACAVQNIIPEFNKQMEKINIPIVIREEEYPNVSSFLKETIKSCTENIENQGKLALFRLAVFLMEAERLFPNAERSEIKEITYGTSAKEAQFIARFISLHYNEHQTAKELANMCYISESQLRRQFISIYNMPPILYRNTLRCRIAAELLIRSDLSVSVITERIAYTSTSDFYKAFKKLYGVSPMAYRKGRP